MSSLKSFTLQYRDSIRGRLYAVRSVESLRARKATPCRETKLAQLSAGLAGLGTGTRFIRPKMKVWSNENTGQEHGDEKNELSSSRGQDFFTMFGAATNPKD